MRRHVAVSVYPICLLLALEGQTASVALPSVLAMELKCQLRSGMGAHHRCNVELRGKVH